MAFQDTGVRLVVLGVSKYKKDIAGVNTVMGNMTRTLSTAGTPLSSFSTKLNSVGDSFARLGTILTVAISAPLTVAITSLTKAGIDFEDAFAGVGKTVDGVSDEFGTLLPLGKEIREGIRALSLELPITAVELAQVAQAAGQVGVGADSLLEFTEIAAKMGVATDLSAEQSALSLARLGNILGISEEDFVGWSKGVSSSLVELGNNVAATESQIVSMSLRLAPAAGIIGLTTQEILGLSASLVEVGVGAERGGTALSRIFLEMAEASGGVKAANDGFTESMAASQPELQRLRSLLSSGVTDFDELSFQLRDTSLDLSGINSLLGDMGSSGGSVSSLNSQIQKNSIIIQGYQRDLNALQEELAKANRQYNKGKITLKEYNAVNDRLSPRIADLRDNMSKAGITAGEYNRRMQDLNSSTVTVDDIIDRVSKNTLVKFEDALAGSSSKVALFADIMGVTEQEFSNAFGAKPLETFQRFVVKLADLQDAGKITSETLAEMGFSGMRVREILNILGPNMGNVTDNIDMASDAWIKQTALQVEVQKRFATVAAQTQLLKNRIANLGITIFDILRPALMEAIAFQSKMVDGLNDLLTGSEKTKKRIILLVAALTALGPALAIIGIALKSIAAITSAASIGFSVLFSPIVVGTIATIGAAFLIWKTNLFGVNTFITDLIDSLSRFTNIRLNLTNAFEGFISGDIEGGIKNIRFAFEGLTFWAQNFGPDLSAINDILSFIADNILIISGFFAGAAVSAKLLNLPLFSTFRILKPITSLLTFISGGPIAVAFGVIGAAILAWKVNLLGVQTLFTKLKESLERFISLPAVLGGMFDTGGTDGGGVKGIDKIKLMLNAFIFWVKTFAIPIIKEHFEDIGAEIKASLGNIPGTIVAAGKGIIGAFTSLVQEINFEKLFVDVIVGVIKAFAAVEKWLFFTGIKVFELFAQLLGAIFKNLSIPLLQFAANVATPLLAELGTLLVSLGDWIFLEAIPFLSGKLSFWAIAFVDWVKDVWPAYSTALSQLVINILTGIADIAIQITDRFISTWLPAFVDWIVKVWPGIRDGTITLFNNIVSWISETVPKLVDSFRNEWLPAFVDWIVKVWPSLRDGTITLVNNIISWISDTGPEILDKLINDWIPAMVGWVAKTWLKLELWLANLLLDILGWVVEVAPGLLNTLVNEWLPAFVGWAAKIWIKLEIWLFTLLFNISTWIVDQAIALTKKFTDEWVPAFIVWIVEMWPKFKEKLEELWELLSTWIRNDAKDDLVEAVESIATAMLDSGSKLGKAIIDGLKQGIEESKPGFKEDMIGVGIKGALWLKDTWDSFSPSRVFEAIGADAMLGLNIGIENMTPTLSNTVTGIANILAAQVRDISASTFNPFSSIGTAARNMAGGATTFNNTGGSTWSRSSTFSPTINSSSQMDTRALADSLARSYRMSQIAVG